MTDTCFHNTGEDMFKASVPSSFRTMASLQTWLDGPSPPSYGTSCPFHQVPRVHGRPRPLKNVFWWGGLDVAKNLSELLPVASLPALLQRLDVFLCLIRQVIQHIHQLPKLAAVATAADNIFLRSNVVISLIKKKRRPTPPHSPHPLTKTEARSHVQST